jgi:protein-arginine kinase
MYRSDSGSHSITQNQNLNENQKSAADYIKNNNVDVLFAEMLNTLVQSNSKEPIVYMIRYLASLVDEADLKKENIKIENLEKIEPIPIVKDFFLPEDSTVFLKKFIDSKVFDQLKRVKTSLGGHISHIIQAGLKVDNKETVGIYATDGEAYTKFVPLFQPAIKFLQNYDKYYSLFDIPDHRGIFDLPMDVVNKGSMQCVRFKYARNLKGFPYLPYAKMKTKALINEKLMKAIKSNKENENGKYVEMELISKSSSENFPEIYEIKNKFFDAEENLFTSLGASKEYSGIFVSEDQKVAYLLNFNDHLQIVVLDDTCNFKQTYNRIRKIHDDLTQELEFDYHSEYGYLTSCPSNIGMGFKISTMLSIPNVVNHGNFMICCKRWSLRLKKNTLFEKGSNEIISKHKVGVSEIAFINSYIVKICSLINFELNLVENPSYVEKQLEATKLKENIKSLYQNYWDKYKFITTPNMKSFNSLFKLDSNKNTYNLFVPDKESYIIYKDFLFDYITAFSNVNMVETTAKDKQESLQELYNRKLTDDEIKEFDDKEKQNLRKTTMIIRRNIKRDNFTASLTVERLKGLYARFLVLANDIKTAYGGAVIEESEIDTLYSTDFKFILEEYNQMFKDKSNIILL